MLTLDFVRSFRIGPYALFDLLLALVTIYVFAPLLAKLFLKIRLWIPKSSWLWFTLPISILVHVIVLRFTPMTRDFFDPHGHYVIKVIVIVCFLLGLRGVTVVPKKSTHT
jgi:hypothetical protein